uniref:Uncharacterized protein n=1 Tax=Arundo donax TaxID=35708 RepID=A0A0A9C2H7_ARUDO
MVAVVLETAQAAVAKAPKWEVARLRE